MALYIAPDSPHPYLVKLALVSNGSQKMYSTVIGHFRVPRRPRALQGALESAGRPQGPKGVLESPRPP